MQFLLIKVVISSSNIASNITATSGNISHLICSLLLVVNIDSLALIHRAIIFTVYLNSKGKVIAKLWFIIHVS